MNRRQALRLRVLDFLGIVIGLKAEPETCTGSEEPRQSDRSVSGDCPLTITYGRDSWLWNTDFLCQPVLTDSHRDQKFFPKNFAGMDIGKFIHGVTSMIVTYFNTAGRPVVPDKADSPLVIDSYAPLSVAITGEFFQSVLWRNPKVVETASIVQHTQLAPRNCLNLARKTAGKFSFPDFEGFVVMERSDHGQILTYNESKVNSKGQWVIFKK